MELDYVIFNHYQQQKNKYRNKKTIPQHLENAWDFIDHLFILESKSKTTNYYDILTFLIPLQKPTTKEEEKKVFIEYLSLLGIENHSEDYLLLLDYYTNHQPENIIDFY